MSKIKIYGYPAANPFGPESAPLDGVAFPPVLVVDAEQDVLSDRTADYVARLRAMGKPVELVVLEGQGHAFFVYEPWGAAAGPLPSPPSSPPLLDLDLATDTKC